MGSGGHVTKRDNSDNRVVTRAPTSKPLFTLGDLKKAIPPHCFNRSLLRSSYYLFIELFFSFLFYYVADTYIVPLSAPLAYVAWPLYWIFQGSVQMGLWEVGHECGHQAFSYYQWLDDTIGYLLHTVMLTPYFSWKYSHRHHHSNAASLEKDASFIPQKKSELNSTSRLFNTPPGRLFRITILCSIGWPLYLGFNVSGRKYEKFANHFSPNSPIYSDSERFQILVTDIGLLVMSYGLYKVALVKGFTWLVMVYFAPLVVVYGFLVVITWLQHTHPSLPHYDSTEWDWLRGALSTVDRDYGVLNLVLHNATRTHVAHHLFPTMPHYNAMEATKAMKPILGEYYQFDDTPVVKALWRETTECFFVEANDELTGQDNHNNKAGVYWFSNKM